MRPLTAALLCMFLLPTLAFAEAGPKEIEAARKMFRQFVRLENSYNPDVVDFYADKAKIVTTVILPGSEREFATTGKAFKEALVPYLVTARNVGERFAYTNVIALPEGNGVRILASRTSQLTDETYPYKAYLARGPGGKWLIYEEHTIVRPASK